MSLSDFFIDVKSLPDNMYGFVQLIFLLCAYGSILMHGSTLISDGSELLLLVPSLAGLVGSVVLPVLGAVPDGCIVLFSGMGPDAQNQLNVGVGTLAGSTVMLLTIPWFLSILGGRVSIVRGKPNYKSHPKLFSTNWIEALYATGVSTGSFVHTGSYIMIGTATTYLFLQVPGLIKYNSSVESVAHFEKNFAFVGFVVCMVFFVSYLVYQLHVSKQSNSAQADRRDQVVERSIGNGSITLMGALGKEFCESQLNNIVGGGASLNEYSHLVPDETKLKKLSVRYAL